MNESRKQFEDWILNVMFKDCVSGMLKRDCWGSRYATVEVQMMWETWKARFKYDGEAYWLGRFDSYEDACEAINQKELEIAGQSRVSFTGE